MEVPPTVHNLAASLVNDKRYTELRVCLYDNLKSTSAYHDAAEAHGAFMGLVRTFEALEYWADTGKAAKLQEYRISQKDKTNAEEPVYADIDMER